MLADDQLVEHPLQFMFATSGSTRILVLKPGFYWSATNGWEAIPGPNGQPTADHMFVPTRFSDVGVNRDLWSVTIRIDPAQMEGASMRLFESDANGASLKPYGWWGLDMTAIQPPEDGKEVIMISNLVLQGLVGKP